MGLGRGLGTVWGSTAAVPHPAVPCSPQPGLGLQQLPHPPWGSLLGLGAAFGAFLGADFSPGTEEPAVAPRCRRLLRRQSPRAARLQRCCGGSAGEGAPGESLGNHLELSLHRAGTRGCPVGGVTHTRVCLEGCDYSQVHQIHRPPCRNSELLLQL